MDDVVALRTETSAGQVRFWMTWGRLFDAVDPAPLLAGVRPHLRYSGQDGKVTTVELCGSLQDAADQPYFYEALVNFAREPIATVGDYDEWRAEKRSRQAEGKDLYYLGNPEGSKP